MFAFVLRIQFSNFLLGRSLIVLRAFCAILFSVLGSVRKPLGPVIFGKVTFWPDVLNFHLLLQLHMVKLFLESRDHAHVAEESDRSDREDECIVREQA